MGIDKLVGVYRSFGSEEELSFSASGDAENGAFRDSRNLRFCPASRTPPSVDSTLHSTSFEYSSPFWSTEETYPESMVIVSALSPVLRE
jgi:hypothetical protein